MLNRPFRNYIEFGLSPAPQSRPVSAVQFGSLAWDRTLECVYGIIYGLCTKPCIGSSNPPEFYSQTPGCLMLKPIFAGRNSNISSYLYGINRSICGRCIWLLVSMSYAQQILENRNISWFNVVELQCNQVDDWLGAPPEIPVIFGAYVYTASLDDPGTRWGANGNVTAW